MKKILFMAGIAATLLTVSCNDSSTKTDTDRKDSAVADADNMKPADNTPPATDPAMGNDAPFAMEAAEGGMAEVKLSELAQKNGTANVKMVADMMIKDHTMAGNELKGIAAKNNITLPTALNDMHQKKYDELSAMKGADFDKAYLDAMQMDHKATIDKFQAEADNGKNGDLKPWAAGKLPTLKGHDEMVKTAMSKMK